MSPLLPLRAPALALICLALSACAPGTGDTPTRAAQFGDALPPMKTFSTPRPERPGRSNADIARDFLDLSFQLESGRELAVFTRFETPITVRVTGAPPPSLSADLTRLIQRLQQEAGIDIRRTNGSEANITIEAVPRARIRQALPQAACFVVPNITSLRDYRRASRSQATDWGLLDSRETLAIFVPNDAAPQEVRDCLHEELAQAIGPLNDLYRLPDTVFNDDNVHTVLTGFDMMILRAYYAPELRSGMSRDQVAARLPGILSRINPAGAGRPATPVSPTPRAWIEAVQTALGPGAGSAQRRASANRAAQIAADLNWQDHRRGFAHYALGRLTQARDPETARQHYILADRYFQASPETRLHRAFVAARLAAYALAEDHPDEALALLAPHPAAAVRHENAALLATLMLLRAEALEQSGRASEARAVRLDSLGWARYGFGSDAAVRAKLREIASLSPPR